MDLKKIDTTDTQRKLRRHTRRLGGVRINTIIWFEEVGAERIPQKSIKIMRSAYKKSMYNYWYYLGRGQIESAALNRERAQHMSKYVKSPDPEQGASRFLEKVRRR